MRFAECGKQWDFAGYWGPFRHFETVNLESTSTAINRRNARFPPGTACASRVWSVGCVSGRPLMIVENPEPQVGIEPTTARLRIECSTTELLWQKYRWQRADGRGQMLRYLPSALCHLPSVRVPWLGFEPRRLTAPPPQDGVSTSFTTRAIPSSATSRTPSTANTQRERRGSNPRPSE